MIDHIVFELPQDEGETKVELEVQDRGDRGVLWIAGFKFNLGSSTVKSLLNDLRDPYYNGDMAEFRS